MKRFTGVRILTQALLDCDVAIFIGEDICKEAAQYTGGGSYLFFPDTEDFILSVAVGMAIGTDKRVFVFCDDNYILRNMSEILQAGIAKARNFFLIILSAGGYHSVPNTPNIMSVANSQHGMFYEMGFLVHNYTNHFKFSKNPIGFIRETWDRVRGPIAVLLKTAKGTKDFPDIRFSGPAEINKTREFILDESIVGHNFVPPISLDQMAIGE